MKVISSYHLCLTQSFSEFRLSSLAQFFDQTAISFVVKHIFGNCGERLSVVPLADGVKFAA
jgi:hypothetical protein